MKISKNYQLSEFAVSETARRRGITFTVPDQYVGNVLALVKNVLQPINDATGWKNKVNSGYRPPEVNKMVGGVPTSQHLTAQASDNMYFVPNDNGVGVKRWVTPYEVLKKVKELGIVFDQMIAYNGFVHLSYRSKGTNRMQVLYNKSYTGKRL